MRERERFFEFFMNLKFFLILYFKINEVFNRIISFFPKLIVTYSFITF